MKTNIAVDEYIQKQPRWQSALKRLREIVLSLPFEETVKWGGPVYTLDGKNLIGLGAFKSYVGIWFFQGALLADKHRKLINAQENKTRAMRQWRFNSEEEIQASAATIKAYLREAIELHRQGKSIKALRNKPLSIPEKLAARLSQNPALKTNFETLSKSRQREYAEYISDAKREATQQKRLEKVIPMILNGVGLNDKYRK